MGPASHGVCLLWSPPCGDGAAGCEWHAIMFGGQGLIEFGGGRPIMDSAACGQWWAVGGWRSAADQDCGWLLRANHALRPAVVHRSLVDQSISILKCFLQD